MKVDKEEIQKKINVGNVNDFLDNELLYVYNNQTRFVYIIAQVKTWIKKEIDKRGLLYPLCKRKYRFNWSFYELTGDSVF